MKFLLLLPLLLFSCGDDEDKKPDHSLKGRWQSYEVRCYREIVFLRDQFFQEVANCRDSNKSHVSTGIWSRSGDNVITMKYVESTDRHLTNVEIHAIVDIDEDRILLTNLESTVVFQRVSRKSEVRYPGKPLQPAPKTPDDEDCTIVINNQNTNTNTNTICGETK